MIHVWLYLFLLIMAGYVYMTEGVQPDLPVNSSCYAFEVKGPRLVSSAVGCLP